MLSARVNAAAHVVGPASSSSNRAGPSPAAAAGHAGCRAPAAHAGPCLTTAPTCGACSGVSSSPRSAALQAGAVASGAAAAGTRGGWSVGAGAGAGLLTQASTSALGGLAAAPLASGSGYASSCRRLSSGWATAAGSLPHHHGAAAAASMPVPVFGFSERGLLGAAASASSSSSSSSSLSAASSCPLSSTSTAASSSSSSSSVCAAAAWPVGPSTSGLILPPRMGLLNTPGGCSTSGGASLVGSSLASSGGSSSGGIGASRVGRLFSSSGASSSSSSSSSSPGGGAGMGGPGGLFGGGGMGGGGNGNGNGNGNLPPPIIISPVALRVVVIGWMGSNRRYLNKYGALWARSGDHEVLMIRPTIAQTLVRWRGVVVAGRDIDRVAALHRENPAMPTVYHIFSTGGFIHAGTMWRWMDEVEDVAQRRDLLEEVAGIILDSAPAAVQPDLAARAIVSAVTNTPAEELAGPDAGGGVKGSLVGGVRSFLDSYLQSKGVKLRTEEVYDAWYNLAPTCPQLYLYSGADPLAPAADVERYMGIQEGRGVDVSSHKWADCGHVDALRRHPHEYAYQISAFLARTLRDW
ncbi:hypothetical protein HYH02_002682 [Chlamydomonas schloesseri]|uniref:Uncharacterized protein n=1 Tax=Chlamydomonas schloesseri TaxID=2026947 RepID=A0A836BAX7_9CHLO|nr:hypothetical protein HYH02_002682 [Chlamydomonas schloesseri]|eukprot:KAG2452439.1 hypothetical protein HYH02_002682 [Chlamydomonas schloesseri]